MQEFLQHWTAVNAALEPTPAGELVLPGDYSLVNFEVDKGLLQSPSAAVKQFASRQWVSPEK